MTQGDELAAALAACLALPETRQRLDPQLWLRAHELLETLKNAPADDAAHTEIGNIAGLSAEALQRRHAELHHEQDTLAGLIRKNREVSQQLEEKLEADRQQRKEAGQSFDIARKLIIRQGSGLLASLGSERMERLVAKNREEILGSPTTAALTRAMQSLLDQAASLLEGVQRQHRQIRALVEAVYARFNDLPDFALAPPLLPNLDDYRQALQGLAAKTAEFCRRPVYLMTDKNSLAKKFGLEVVSPLRKLFAQLRGDTDRWLRESCVPLQERLQQQKMQQERRAEDIAKVRDYLLTLETRLEEADMALARLRRQEEAIARIQALLRLH